MIVVLHQMSNFSTITWWEQVTFDEMMSALYRNNRFIRNNRFHWLFIVLALCNNSLQVEISPHSYTLLWILTNQSFFLLHLNVAFLSRKAINTNLKVFGLTSLALEPTICYTRGKHAHYYTTGTFFFYNEINMMTI